MLRSLDVPTSNTPLVGMPTTLSQSIGEQAHHLGPSEFWVLWLPTLVSDAVGAPIVAVGVLNALWLGAAVYWASRIGGAGAAVLTAALVLVSVVGLDSWVLADPRNPYVALAAFACFVVAVVASCARRWWAVPWAVAAGSFAAQAHLSFAPLVAAVGGSFVIAAVVVAVSRRRGADEPAPDARRPWRWPLLVAGLVGAAFWWPVIADQLWGAQNISAVLGPSGDEVSGLRAGWDFVVHGVASPLDWFAGHTEPANVLVDNRWYQHVAVAASVSVAAFLAVWWRRRHRGVAAAAAVAVVTLLAGVLALGRLPVGGFGAFASHNQIWLRPAGGLLWGVLACAAALAVRDRWPAFGELWPRAVATGSGAAVVAVLSVAALLGPVELQANPTVGPAQEAVERLDVLLDADEPYEVGAQGEHGLTGLTAALVLGLERAGLDVGVAEEQAVAFGEHRVTASDSSRLTGIIGHGEHVAPSPDSSLVLHLPPEREALDELASAEQAIEARLRDAGGLVLRSGERYSFGEARELLRAGGIGTLAGFDQILEPDLPRSEIAALEAARGGRVLHLHVYLDNSS